MLSEKLEIIRNRHLEHTAGPKEAVAAIEIAFAYAAENDASTDRLADLADAVDAFREGAHGIAASLARTCTVRRREIAYMRRPASMSMGLVELRDIFVRHKRQRGL